MTSRPRISRKRVLAGLLVLVLPCAGAVSALAFPQPFFPHQRRFGVLTIASDHPLPGDIAHVVDQVRARAAAMEHPLSRLPYRVFICEDERVYRFFTTLARRPSRTQAFILTLPGNMFLNANYIRRVARRGPGSPRHWRFHGDLVDAITHEVAHLSMGRELDKRAAARLPFWKAEGFADYQVQRAPILADSAYSLPDRIDLLLESDHWRGDGSARRFFRWQLMVEYMVGVKGMDLHDIADETVTESGVYAEMIEWRRLRPQASRQEASPPAGSRASN